ncbi:MAG: putative repeat protein (TIGR02059 family), partial [Planctomycetota bacterium]
MYKPFTTDAYSRKPPRKQQKHSARVALAGGVLVVGLSSFMGGGLQTEIVKNPNPITDAGFGSAIVVTDIDQNNDGFADIIVSAPGAGELTYLFIDDQGNQTNEPIPVPIMNAMGEILTTSRDERNNIFGVLRQAEAQELIIQDDVPEVLEEPVVEELVIEEEIIEVELEVIEEVLPTEEEDAPVETESGIIEETVSTEEETPVESGETTEEPETVTENQEGAIEEDPEEGESIPEDTEAETGEVTESEEIAESTPEEDVPATSGGESSSGGASTETIQSQGQGEGFGIALSMIRDINDDSIADLAIARDNGSVTLYTMERDGSIKPSTIIENDSLRGFGKSLGYYRKGHVLAVGSTDGAIALYDIQGDGSVDDPAIFEHTDKGFGSSVALSREGILAVGSSLTQTIYLYDVSTSAVPEKEMSAFGFGAGGFGAALSFVGDVNGDGQLDLAVGAPEDGDRGNGYILVLGESYEIIKIISLNDENQINLKNGDRYGSSIVSLGERGDGMGIIVGAPGSRVSGDSGAGAVYVHVVPEVDTNAPEHLGSVFSGDVITLTFDKELDPESLPQLDDFEILVSGIPAQVKSIEITESTVLLALGGLIGEDQSVTLAYTPTDAIYLSDRTGNRVEIMPTHAVTSPEGFQGMSAGDVGMIEIEEISAVDIRSFGDPSDRISIPENASVDLRGQDVQISGVLELAGVIILEGGEDLLITPDRDSGTVEYRGNGDGIQDSYTLPSPGRGDIDYYNLTLSSDDTDDIFTMDAPLLIEHDFVLESGVFNQTEKLIVDGLETCLVTGGVFNQGAPITCAGDFVISGGAFNGGSDTITIGGDFVQTGGIFNSTSTTLLVSGDFAHTAGTWNHNSGDMRLVGDDATHTLSGVTTFNNFTMVEGDDSTFGNLVLPATQTTAIDGVLTLRGQDATDRITVTSNPPGATATLDMNISGGATYGTIEYLALVNQQLSENGTTKSPVLNPANSLDGGNTPGWISGTFVPGAAITVDSTADVVASDGLCTLRGAVANANDNAPTDPDCVAGTEIDTIEFNIPGGGVQTITLGSSIAITSPVVIDGVSQPDARCDTPANPNDRSLLVRITGNLLQFTTGSDFSVVQGIVRGGAGGGNGFRIDGTASDLTFRCNHIGTNATATATDPG